VPVPAGSGWTERVGRQHGARCWKCVHVLACSSPAAGLLHSLQRPASTLHLAPQHPAPTCMLNCLKRRRLSWISRRIRGALSARRAGPRLAHPTAELLRPCTAKFRAVRSTTKVREASKSVRTAKASPWRLRSCPNALRQEGDQEGCGLASCWAAWQTGDMPGATQGAGSCWLAVIQLSIQRPARTQRHAPEHVADALPVKAHGQ
jgi:hypothetical protein